MAGLGPVDIDGAKIQKIAHVALKIDKDGFVKNEMAEVDITLRISHAQFMSNAVRLGKAWALRADVSGRIDFTEQLGLGLGESVRKDADSNGHERDAGKLSAVTPIGERSKKKGAETPA